MLRDALIALVAVVALAAVPARGGEVEVASAAGHAQPPRDPVPSTSPVWLDLLVNQVSGGTILVQVGDGDAWVSEEDLALVKLDVSGHGERVAGSGGRSLVSLRSLAPRLTYEIDERSLALRITVGETLLGRSAVDLATRLRPAGLATRGEPSAFLNWGASVGTGDARSGSAELGLSKESALLIGGATMDASGSVVRGLTTGYYDDGAALVRYAAGDVVVSPPDSLAGSVLLGGAAAWREFGLDPYFVKAPLPSTTVFASTPSTLEVWVNDAIVRRVPVAPGTIDLEHLPIVSGPNEVRTVLRDAFGREQTSTTSALLGSNLIAPGLVDWGAFAGFRRQGFGTESFDYGTPVALGRGRAGLSQRLTLAGRLEVSQSLVSVGTTVAVATPYGEIDASLAGSGSAGMGGAALSLAWRSIRRRVEFGLELRAMSDRYANASLEPGDDRASYRAKGIVSTAIARRLSLMLEGDVERLRDESAVAWRGAFRALWRIGRGYHAGFSAIRTGSELGAGEWGIYTSISGTLPDGGTGEVSASSTSTGGGSQLAVQRQLAQGPGVGYRAVAGAGDGAVASAEVMAQGGPGRVAVRYDANDPWSRRRVSAAAVDASGGLVFMRGKLFPSLPVNGSYAVVSVPGVPGVTAYLNNHVAGRTDGDGDLLIPGLAPRLANKVRIRDADIPLEYRVSEVERLVAPTYRGGTVEQFDVQAMRAITGKLRLRIESGTVVPEYGEVAVEVPGKRILSPIGSDGAFWLDEMPAGTVEALVRWEGRLCRISFTVPVAAGVSDAGTVECTQLLAKLDGPQGVAVAP